MLSGEQWLELKCKTSILRGNFTGLKQLDATFPNIRELLIQVAKLDRLLSDYVRWKPPTGRDLLARRVSLKKLNKDRGKKTAAIHKQFKKVNSIAEVSTKEWFRREKPMTNAEFRLWFKAFKFSVEKSAKESAKELMRQVKAQEPPRVPPSRPFGRIGTRHPI